ncbi:MAG TPA: hypothetical protein VF457_18860, partial [Burkholderiaceae bacterium]
MTSPLATIAPGRPEPGHWEVVARGGLALRIHWTPEDEGRRVRVRGRALAAPEEQPSREAVLGFAHDEAREVVWVFGEGGAAIDVTVSFWHGHGPRGLPSPPDAEPHRHDERKALLWVNLPLTPSEYLDRAVAEWRTGRHPAPWPPIDPVDPDDPFDPGTDPPDEVDTLTPLPGASDLFPFLWLAAPSPAEALEMDERWMRPLPPWTQMSLYGTLAAEAGDGAATRRRADATDFRRKNASLFTGLGAWPAPTASLPEVRLELLAEDGPRTPDVLLREADDLLQPLGSSVSQLLEPAAGGTMSAVEAQAWEVMFVLALVGTAADAALAAGLIDVLRVYHYLHALSGHAPPVARELVRRRLLEAAPALPDDVAACPLSGAVKPAPAPAPPPPVTGEWFLLGVGELAIARQRLRGYVPGELAEIVNLMPRERQERHERQRTSTERREDDRDDRQRVDDRTQQSAAHADLADTLREAMAAAGMACDLTQVKPSYSNLNLMLGGSGSQADAGTRWDADRVARLVQRASERATQTLSERAGRQRREVWRDWHEQRSSRCIDNRDGERLVGVYRWVDRLLH